MNKENILKILIYIVGSLMALGLFGQCLYFFDFFNLRAETEWISDAGTMGGIIVMITYGMLIKNKKMFSAMCGAYSLLILAAIFKVLHLTGANELVLVADLSIVVVYFFHFIKKTEKNQLDIFKLIWVIASTTIGVIVVEHIFPESKYMLENIQTYMVIALFADFAYVKLPQMSSNHQISKSPITK